MRKKFEIGFTIIELITIILLLSIISVTVISRLGNLSVFTDRGLFEETLSAVRYAQKLAISSGCEVRVDLSASGYTLLQGGSCNSGAFTLAVMDPTNRSIPYANPNISITPADTFEFTPQSTVDNLGADVTFTVNGDTAIIGGLMEDSINQNSTGLPGLHDVNGFGFLFGSKEQLKDKTELVIFLRPRIIDTASVNSDLADFKRYLKPRLLTE